MVALVALGLVLTRVVGGSKSDVSEERAVEIAAPSIDFEPDGHTIRFLRRGIPPRPFWAVSFWTRKPSGDYGRVTVVLVDAKSGRVTEVRRSA